MLQNQLLCLLLHKRILLNHCHLQLKKWRKAKILSSPSSVANLESDMNVIKGKMTKIEESLGGQMKNIESKLDYFINYLSNYLVDK